MCQTDIDALKKKFLFLENVDYICKSKNKITAMGNHYLFECTLAGTFFFYLLGSRSEKILLVDFNLCQWIQFHILLVFLFVWSLTLFDLVHWN